MPHYYLKNVGGAAKVRRFVGLAPSNHGTTLDGLIGALPRAFGELGEDIEDYLIDWVGQTAPGLTQQVAGSGFQTQLFGSGDTVPGVSYTTIANPTMQMVLNELGDNSSTFRPVCTGYGLPF